MLGCQWSNERNVRFDGGSCVLPSDRLEPRVRAIMGAIRVPRPIQFMELGDYENTYPGIWRRTEQFSVSFFRNLVSRAQAGLGVAPWMESLIKRLRRTTITSGSWSLGNGKQTGSKSDIGRKIGRAIRSEPRLGSPGRCALRSHIRRMKRRTMNTLCALRLRHQCGTGRVHHR